MMFLLLSLAQQPALLFVGGTLVDGTGSPLRARTLDAWEKCKDHFFVTPTLVVPETMADGYGEPDPRSP